MSTITSNWKQNCFSPVNKSPSKMAFSFSKANRFSSDKENKSQIFYNVSPKVDKRATTFGYGNKYDFTKDQPSSPPPNVYSIPDTFDPESKHKPGFCFGQSREGMIITGPLASTINNKNPGPGAYEPLKKTSHISYSLRGKVKPPQPEAQKVPGPGTYQQNNFFTKDGTIFNSKHSNHKAAKFNSGGERFKPLDCPFPGPGRYDTSKVEFSSSGRYSLSNLHNSKVRSFGHATRQSFANRCKTPGPGSYCIPSEFGCCQNERYVQKSSKISFTQQAP